MGKVFLGSSEVKASACNAGDLGSIPGLGRSPGEGNGNPLQYSCLENPMDGGAWWATVHGVTKSQTRLSDFTFTFCLQYRRLGLNPWVGKISWRRKWQYSCLEKFMDRGALVGFSPWDHKSRTRLLIQQLYV